MANTLAHDVLGRSLDELPPQTRKLLQLINAMVNERCTQQATKVADYRFSRKAVRDVTGWGDTQLRVHLDRLTQMEYLITHRGTRGQSFVYELLWDAKTDNASAHLPGLLDVESLKSMTTTQSSRGEAGEFAGSTRPQNGGLAGGSRPAKNTKTIEKKHVENVLPDELIENARPVQKINNESYTQVSSLAAASSSS